VDDIPEEILSLLEESKTSLSISEISKKLNHGRQTTARHLDHLLHCGKISMIQHGIKKRYYISKPQKDPTIENYSSQIQVIFQPDLTVIQVNDGFLKWAGLSKESAIGEKLGCLLRGFSSVDINLTSIQSLKKGQSIHFDDLIYIHKTPHIFQFTVSYFSLKKDDDYIFLSAENITHKKKLEQELLDSEEKFRTLAQNIPGIVFRLDIKLKKFDYCNQFYEITGYHPVMISSFTYHPLEHYIFTDDIERVSKTSLKAILTGNYYEIEYRILDPRNKIMHLLERGKPIYGKSGKYEYIDGVIFDISDRKQIEEEIIQNNELLILLNNELTEAELQLKEQNTKLLCTQQELIESREHYQFLFESAPVGIAISDLEGKMIVANSFKQELCGYSESDNPPLTFLNGFEFSDELDHFFEILKHYKKVRDFEAHLVRKNGTRFTALINADLIEWKNRPRIFITSRDITALKKVEEDLRISHANYQHLIENISDVAWILDPESWYFTYVSSSVERLRGYSAEEILSKPADDGLDSDITSDIRNVFQTRLQNFIIHKNETEFFRLEVEERCKNGSKIWTDIICHFVYNNYSRKVELHGITRDITDRKKWEIGFRREHQLLLKTQSIGHIGSWEYNAETRNMWGSDEYFRILGIDAPPDGIFTFDLIRSIIPDYSILAEPLFKLFKEPGSSPYSLIIPVFPSDGSPTRIISVIAEGIPQTNGSPAKIAGVIMDITDQKLMEEKYRQSEEKYRILFETINQGIVYHNSDLKVTSYNPASLRILGVTDLQIQGVAPYDLKFKVISRNGEQYVHENQPSMAAFMSGKRTNSDIISFFNPELNGLRWILVDSIPLKEPGNPGIKEVCTVFTDITDLKRAQEKIVEANSDLDNVVTHAVSPIIVVDSSLTIIKLNKVMADLTGLSINESLGKNLEILFPLNVRTHYISLIREQFAGKQPAEFEIPIFHQSGQIFNATWISTNILNSNGKIAATIAQGQNVTESDVINLHKWDTLK
jgi:PAS domain S-box-containing protein